ncbi:MAG: Flp pilus assembly protein CpaB [Solirubrobacteraceae bacterium]|nr:Flp pilus assembly protein CpaB [Solirubrobacteraceae bacterium]
MSAMAGAPLRRAAVLAVLAAALAFGAVRTVARREAEVDARIGPVGTIVVVARDVPAGRTLRPADLAYRSVPLRWVAPRTLAAAEDAVGLRSVVALGRGTPLLQAVLTSTSQQASAALASGDRVIELVAAGSVRLVKPGARVDVIASVTGADGQPRTRVIAEAVEVLEIREADAEGDEPRVAVTLRAARTQALRLAAAGDGDGTLRLLPRAAWDRAGLAPG